MFVSSQKYHFTIRSQFKRHFHEEIFNKKLIAMVNSITNKIIKQNGNFRSGTYPNSHQ